MFFLIQQSNTGIQIPGKGDPEQIGDQQRLSGIVDFSKEIHGQINEDPQDQQQDKSHKVPLQAKENQGPEKIQDKLDKVKSQRLSDGIRVGSRGKDPVGSVAHQQVEYGPYDGEYPSGR